MGVEVEHGIPRQGEIPLDQLRRPSQRGKCLPDFLVNDEGMRIVCQRLEQELDRAGGVTGR
jgi:hypothetical protein